MYSIKKAETYPGLEGHLGGVINVKQIEAHWDDLHRLTSSIRKGTVTASLILGKLAAYPRQNGLAYALREVDRIEKSLFALEWLQSPGLRRRVQVGLNAGFLGRVQFIPSSPSVHWVVTFTSSTPLRRLHLITLLLPCIGK